MARRKKTSRKSPRRRSRRMGAIGKAGVMELAYQVAGGIAASVVSKAVEKALASQSSMDEKTKSLIANAVPVVAGFVLPQKSPLMKGLATGMKIAGATKLISGVAGIGRMGALYNAEDFTPMIAGMPTDFRTDTLNNPMYVAGAY